MSQSSQYNHKLKKRYTKDTKTRRYDGYHATWKRKRIDRFLIIPKKIKKNENKIETKTKAPSEYNNLKKILQQQKLNEIPAKKPL